MGLGFSSCKRAKTSFDKKNTKQDNTQRILLLGTGESGKSTIVKQLRLIHNIGFTRDEMDAIQTAISRNILDSARALASAMVKFQMSFENHECQVYANELQNLDFIQLTRETFILFASRIKAIWEDPAIRRLMERQSEFYLLEAAPYFFDAIDRIAEATYLPTEMDVLRCRSRTIGVSETTFRFPNMTIQMVDVGGQRAERKKWIHCFENVHAVLFVIALSEYDQVLLEDPTQSRMSETLTLFESIVNSRWFTRTSCIIFLNKADIFQEKLKTMPLSICFPEYTGPDDYTTALKFILWRLKQLNRANLTLYPHLTCATDRQLMETVFHDVQNNLLEASVKKTGTL